MSKVDIEKINKFLDMISESPILSNLEKLEKTPVQDRVETKGSSIPLDSLVKVNDSITSLQTTFDKNQTSLNLLSDIYAKVSKIEKDTQKQITSQGIQTAVSTTENPQFYQDLLETQVGLIKDIRDQFRPQIDTSLTDETEIPRKSKTKSFGSGLLDGVGSILEKILGGGMGSKLLAGGVLAGVAADKAADLFIKAFVEPDDHATHTQAAHRSENNELQRLIDNFNPYQDYVDDDVLNHITEEDLEALKFFSENKGAIVTGQLQKQGYTPDFSTVEGGQEFFARWMSQSNREVGQEWVNAHNAQFPDDPITLAEWNAESSQPMRMNWKDFYQPEHLKQGYKDPTIPDIMDPEVQAQVYQETDARSIQEDPNDPLGIYKEAMPGERMYSDPSYAAAYKRFVDQGIYDKGEYELAREEMNQIKKYYEDNPNQQKPSYPTYIDNRTEVYPQVQPQGITN